MKTGYSILLGEYIAAAEIEYRDCEAFQIVCPACKEPIFKCVREEDPAPVHYLSHYRSKSSFDEDCELRVSRISNKEMADQNTLSRDQKLKYFLAVLQEMIWRHEFSADSRIDKVKTFFHQIDRAKALGKFKEICLDICRRNWRGQRYEDHHGLLDDYIRDVTETRGSFFPTSFSIQVQKRIAWDMWQYLLSKNAEPNLSFLFNLGYTFLMIRIDQARESRELHPWEVYLRVRMERLVQTSKDKGLEMLAELRNYRLDPPFSAERGSGLLIKLAAETSHEMLGCLLRLPYADMSKEKQRRGGEKPPRGPLGGS